jgi:two-component system, cell cycle sensor histidine kinase and response regulator CckA
MSRALQVLDAAALAVDEALTFTQISTALDTAFTDLGWDYALLLKDDGVELTASGEHPSLGTETKAGDPLAPVEILRRIEGMVERQEVLQVDGQPVLVAGKAAELEPLQGAGSIDLPLVFREQVTGLLSVYPRSWVQQDLLAVATLARRLAPALRRAQAVNELQQRLDTVEQSLSQSLQAQKLEAIARLAGGVAHDFNNALTVIRLSVQLIKLRLPPHDDRLRGYVRQIEEAEGRAAAMTEQLLSFSQRDEVETRIVDLNQLIRGLVPMVQHIVGQAITLATSLEDALWPVRLDPTRWDQVVFQLAAHARDAMPSGGTLRIETANVLVDPSVASSHPGIKHGSYVLLSLSDTGPGLEPEVRARLFEPFFSTSERVTGSSLGLAMVYATVQQNSGQIRVSSEPGEGTTFHIYLPRAKAA